MAAITCFAASPAEASSPPEAIWAQSIGEIDAEPDEVDGIAVDDSDRTYASGVFRHEVSFEGSTFVSRGEGDIFLASYSSTGSLRWARQIGGAGDDNTFDLQSDGRGIVASGWFAGRVDFGGKTLTSAGSQDMFLARYDSRGRLEWAHSFGGPAGDGGNELDVLPDGEIAVAAISEGDFVVDGRTYPGGGGGRDAYAMRVSAEGDVRWVRPFNGAGTERIRAMAMNRSGEVFVGFQYRGAVEAGALRVESAGDWDGAAAKLTAGGDPVWLLPFGGAGVDNVRGIAPGEGGSVYASGVFQGPATLAGREQPAAAAGGDDFLMRLSAAGQPEWLVTQAGPGASTGPEIRSDARGVIASSVLSGPTTITREGEPLSSLASPGGNPTSLLAAYDPDGQMRFSFAPESVGPGSAALGDVLAISPDGRYVAQALRYRGSLLAAGSLLSTPSERDSAIVFLRTDAAAKARITAATPRLVRLAPGGRAYVRVTVRNRGDADAERARICPSASRADRRRLRVGRCIRLEPLRANGKRSERLPVRVTPDAPRGTASLRLQLQAQDSRRSSVVVRVRVRS